MINEHLEEPIPPHCCDSLKKYILNGVSPLLEGKPKDCHAKPILWHLRQNTDFCQ